MTPEARRTLKRVFGVVGLLVFAIAMVYMWAPQLRDTIFREGVMYVMAGIGLGHLFGASIIAVVSNSNGKRHHK